MKKQVVILLTVFLFAGGRLLAQKDSVVSLPPITVTATTQISNVLANAFEKTFPEAINVYWYKFDKDYLAKFIENDMSHNALFRKNGVMKYDVSFGYADNLPAETRQMVESAYPEYNITRAFRVKEGGRDIWVVNLESVNSYVTARVEDNELEEVQHFTKS